MTEEEQKRYNEIMQKMNQNQVDQILNKEKKRISHIKNSANKEKDTKKVIKSLINGPNHHQKNIDEWVKNTKEGKDER